MKYKIKIVTYGNGSKEYTPYVKKRFGWSSISDDGSESAYFSKGCSSRERALKHIDRHFNGDAKVQSIVFEYITKA